MLDVHQQQLLVLLLVVEAELDRGHHLVEGAGVQADDEVAHPVVDVAAVDPDVVGARTADEAAVGACVSRPDRLVVAVEQEPVLLLVGREAGLVVGEDEGLEEPGDVRPMPLGGGDVGHRLDGLVLRRERSGE